MRLAKAPSRISSFLQGSIIFFIFNNAYSSRSQAYCYTQYRNGNPPLSRFGCWPLPSSAASNIETNSTGKAPDPPMNWVRTSFDRQIQTSSTGSMFPWRCSCMGVLLSASQFSCCFAVTSLLSVSIITCYTLAGAPTLPLNPSCSLNVSVASMTITSDTLVSPNRICCSTI